MLLTLTLLSSLLHVGPAADSVSGTWRVTGDVQGNAVNELCTLKQAGAAITGSCAAEGGPTYPVTGEVKEGKVTFRHGGEYQGQALTLTYAGTLASAKEIKGTIDVQPFAASGTFSAAPASATPAATAPATTPPATTPPATKP